MLRPAELTLEEMGDLADIIPAADPEVRVARAGDDTRTTDAPGYDGVVSAASAAGAH